jgi:glycine dehydrogenase
MVKVTGFGSMEELIDATVPKSIKRKELMDMGKYTEGFTESGFLSMFK